MSSGDFFLLDDDVFGYVLKKSPDDDSWVFWSWQNLLRYAACLDHFGEDDHRIASFPLWTWSRTSSSTMLGIYHIYHDHQTLGIKFGPYHVFIWFLSFSRESRVQLIQKSGFCCQTTNQSPKKTSNQTPKHPCCTIFPQKSQKAPKKKKKKHAWPHRHVVSTLSVWPRRPRWCNWSPPPRFPRRSAVPWGRTWWPRKRSVQGETPKEMPGIFLGLWLAKKIWV